MKLLLDKIEIYFDKEKFSKTKNDFYVNNRLEDDDFKFNSILVILLDIVLNQQLNPITIEVKH